MKNKITKAFTSNKFGLSPIFATVLLATIVIFAGSIAYYFSSNLMTTASNQYADALSDTQQSLSERVGFENVVYTSSSPATLTVYIINCGSVNNLKIDSVFIYDVAHNLVGQPSSGSQISPLRSIDTGSLIVDNHLNVGQEGYFTVSLSGLLVRSSMYNLHLITKSGSSFNYAFVP